MSTSRNKKQLTKKLANKVRKETEVQREINLSVLAESFLRKCSKDFPPKDINILLKSLKKKIMKDFGKQCPDYVAGCACCKIWKAFNTIKKLYE